MIKLYELAKCFYIFMSFIELQIIIYENILWINKRCLKFDVQHLKIVVGVWIGLAHIEMLAWDMLMQHLVCWCLDGFVGPDMMLLMWDCAHVEVRYHGNDAAHDLVDYDCALPKCSR